MKDYSKEILAYSLQNSIDFGKTNTSKVLPKLFQHGLEKFEIKKVMPMIQEAVEKVNSWDLDKRKMEFAKLEIYVISRVKEEKRELPELLKLSKKMRFRLAPFPSGALHIGNAKTYLLNALYAEKYNADLILMIDDTIGSEDKPPLKEGYSLIEDAFTWLKVNYKKPIYYKSSRLKIYYKYALVLIRKDKAYVCRCSAEEVKTNRAKGMECSCRQFPPEDQIIRWKAMFKLKQGDATLRIKTDMMDPNPAFRDRILFKISDREHPKVGKKYSVWPSLEMSWAVDDHLLEMTHIIRGNELMMETQMEEYLWNIFGWEHAQFIHTGLVKLSGTIGKISKSKAMKEVLSGAYIGWDDPRTWSIQSLRKRGIRPEALRQLVFEIGLNKQNITLPIETLYAINRSLIDSETDRYFFVPEPYQIKLSGNCPTKADLPVHPEKKERRVVSVRNTIFISKEDYKKFKGKEIRLLHLCNIKLGKAPTVTSIENKAIPKIQWVSEHVPARVLMTSGSWISGLAESSISNLTEGDVIQFERFGFCRFDRKKGDFYEFWFGHK